MIVTMEVRLISLSRCSANGNSNRTSLSLAPSGFNLTYIGGSFCADSDHSGYCRNHLVGKTNPDQDTNYHSYPAKPHSIIQARIQAEVLNINAAAAVALASTY
ncbi:MAG: hypothetical protein IPP38_10210 [Bacteroidetes bacterium]|nr:hypothetical protein [Bacteroidota bacterium]